MWECEYGKFCGYTPVTCTLQRYMLYNFSVDFFYNQLISFHDEFLYKINKKIDYVSKDIIDGICALMIYIDVFRDRNADENIIDIDTIKKCKYLDFFYFLDRLVKMMNKELEINSEYLIKILYLDTNILSRIGPKGERSFFNDGCKSPISTKTQGDQKTILNFKKLVTLDIMKEYHYATKPKKDPRFSLLKPMLKKYKSYDKVPDDIQPNFRYRIFFKKRKIYTKSQIVTHYFKYISYNLKKNLNPFEQNFDHIILKYLEFLELYNSRVLRNRGRVLKKYQYKFFNFV
ncbi:hypothetical protein CDIK_3037 [Cucumispora dikerogammari]|nr:hypothetical protein CDIK_3037 [Cucumispora dikerogammari]